MATRAQYQAAAEIIETLDAATDESGILQAEDALRIMPRSQPTWHEAQTYATAARRLGLEQDEDGEWYAAAERGLDVGDRVEAGEGEDHDTGVVAAVDGSMARVAWDSGVETWGPLADLRPTSERHSGGHRME